jgi:hypothetical protein
MFYKPKEFDNTPYSYCYTISILLVRNIKRYNAVLNLVYKKQEVYIVYTYKERHF